MIARPMRAAPFLLSLALCACASPLFPKLLPTDEAILSRSLTCPLPPPGAAGESINVAQSLAISYGDLVSSFEAQLQIAPDAVDLVALDNLGRRAMTINWRTGNIEVTRASWLPPTVRAADILIDVAIVYFPHEPIAAALSACGVTLATTADGRTVTDGDDKLIVVTYESGDGWNRTANLQNLSLGLRIDIRSAVLAP